MKKVIMAAVVSLVVIGFGDANAQVPVNIIYPINGGTYPVGGGLPTGGAEYINASFSVTCQGGSHIVKWGFNGTQVGSEGFYDQVIVQQTYKLPAGSNSFFVKSDCGSDFVRFKIDH
jgi:hypothetical protein